MEKNVECLVCEAGDEREFHYEEQIRKTHMVPENLP